MYELSSNLELFDAYNRAAMNTAQKILKFKHRFQIVWQFFSWYSSKGTVFFFLEKDQFWDIFDKIVCKNDIFFCRRWKKIRRLSWVSVWGLDFCREET